VFKPADRRKNMPRSLKSKTAKPKTSELAPQSNAAKSKAPGTKKAPLVVQDVRVVNDPLAVDVREDALLVTLFSRVTIPGGGNTLGPSGGLNLTGYTEYRLVLRFDGAANTPFTINELYGPAGNIDQLNTDIASGTIGSLGSLNYRAKFNVFGPRAFFIRVFNYGGSPLRVSRCLYAVK
jgi:hypothetical protein